MPIRHSPSASSGSHRGSRSPKASRARWPGSGSWPSAPRRVGYASGMSATPGLKPAPAPARAREHSRPRTISVVIPVYNEAESVLELVASLASVLGQGSAPYEILFVDDGSTDGTFDAIAGARAA